MLGLPAAVLRTVRRAMRESREVLVVRVSLQGFERVQFPAEMPLNRLTMSSQAVVKVLTAGTVLAVRSFFAASTTKTLMRLMFCRSEGVWTIFPSSSSRQGSGVKADCGERLKTADCEQSALGKEEVSLGSGGSAVSRLVQSCGLSMKQQQVLASWLRRLPQRSSLLRVILAVAAAICVLATRLNWSFSWLLMATMSSEILPKRTSMMASVRMRRMRVLRVKMMMIFFQKLSCVNQVRTFLGATLMASTRSSFAFSPSALSPVFPSSPPLFVFSFSCLLFSCYIFIIVRSYDAPRRYAGRTAGGALPAPQPLREPPQEIGLHPQAASAARGGLLREDGNREAEPREVRTEAAHAQPGVGQTERTPGQEDIQRQLHHPLPKISQLAHPPIPAHHPRPHLQLQVTHALG